MLETIGSLLKIELEFRVSVLVEGGKPESLERNPRSKDKN